MLRKFSNLKIKHQFIILTLSAVVLVLVIQSLYYIKISKITTGKIKTFTDQSISQTDETTKLVFEKIKNSAAYFSFSSAVQNFLITSDSFEKYSVKKYIDDIIRPALEINHEILNVVLIDQDGQPKYYYTETEVPIYDFTGGLREKVTDNDFNKGFLFFESRLNTGYKYITYVTEMKYYSGSIRYGETVGYIAILIDPDILLQIIKKAANPEIAEFYLLDNNNQIVASNLDAGETGHKNGKMLNNPDHKSNHIKLSKEIADTGWSITAIINEKEVISEYSFFKSFGIIVGAIMVFLLAGMGLSFNRNIALPVLSLHKEMDKLGRNNLKDRIKLPYKNEFGDIAENINRMLDNIEALSRRIFVTQQKMYESELSRKQTELYALQSQVNPHFLFNTLQCIGGIAAAKDVMEVSEVANSMAEIFRYSIKGSDMVLIKDEVYIVSQYLKIIEVRFGGRIKWDIDIQDEILEYETIKMIMQPLVENAVYHGLEQSYDEGYICIKGWMENGCIIIEIRDNGLGIEEELLHKFKNILEDRELLEKESNRRQRIGIANIQWRIKLILGNEYGLSIESRKGEGTTVRVKLPAIKT